MIAQRRLHTQRLIEPKFPTPVDVVAFFGAVQAQDFLPAMWALGMRTDGRPGRSRRPFWLLFGIVGRAGVASEQRPFNGRPNR